MKRDHGWNEIKLQQQTWFTNQPTITSLRGIKHHFHLQGESYSTNFFFWKPGPYPNRWLQKFLWKESLWNCEWWFSKKISGFTNLHFQVPGTCCFQILFAVFKLFPQDSPTRYIPNRVVSNLKNINPFRWILESFLLRQALVLDHGGQEAPCWTAIQRAKIKSSNSLG